MSCGTVGWPVRQRFRRHFIIASIFSNCTLNFDWNLSWIEISVVHNSKSPSTDCSTRRWLSEWPGWFHPSRAFIYCTNRQNNKVHVYICSVYASREGKKTRRNGASLFFRFVSIRNRLRCCWLASPPSLLSDPFLLLLLIFQQLRLWWLILRAGEDRKRRRLCATFEFFLPIAYVSTRVAKCFLESVLNKINHQHSCNRFE